MFLFVVLLKMKPKKKSSMCPESYLCQQKTKVTKYQTRTNFETFQKHFTKLSRLKFNISKLNIWANIFLSTISFCLQDSFSIAFLNGRNQFDTIDPYISSPFSALKFNDKTERDSPFINVVTVFNRLCILPHCVIFYRLSSG